MSMPHRWSRRQVVQGAGAVGLGLLAGCGRWPGQAQPPPRTARVGYLGSEPDAPEHEAFRQGLRELGWINGRDLFIDYRWTERNDEFPTLATDLVGLPVDLIVAAAGTASVLAAQQATLTIPIVFTTAVEPVETGLVVSLARPGGNVTGLSVLSPQTDGKRLELLKEMVPGLARVAHLSVSPERAVATREVRAAAEALGVHYRVLDVVTTEDIEGAVDAAVSWHADALWTGGNALALSHRARIVDLAMRVRLPVVAQVRPYAEAGALFSYGPSRLGNFHRAAYYVDRILKGAQPADLPVEQPMRFDFVVNLQTAQALALTIPPHVLLQATEVIQ
jgi:putative tryptophan/tyrosine transport system substrate-binding protein